MERDKDLGKNKDKGNIFILGTSAAAGGTYNKVRITGEGEIGGDLTCASFTCTGNAHLRGGLTSATVKLTGTMSAEGKVTAERLVLQGQVEIGGDCEAESCHLKGAATIKGLLNAGDIRIILYGDSHAAEIGGGKITVRKRGDAAWRKWFKSLAYARLTTDTIEGDEVYVEHTTARIVRGNHVTVGPGCEIERVEYKNGFKQVAGSSVKRQKKI